MSPAESCAAAVFWRGITGQRDSVHTGRIDGGLAWFHDPIVEEVWAIREQLAAQFNFDTRKIVEDAQRRQATSGSRIVSFERPDMALHVF